VSVGGVSNFNTVPAPVDITLTAGDHLLEFTVGNAGGPAGFACTISQPPPGQPNPPPEKILWDTRTNAVINEKVKSTYTLTPKFNATVTAHIWGAGGGGGGGDSGATGGSGRPGLYNSKTFTVAKGKTIEVSIGASGGAGISGRPCIGGAGGFGRVRVDGAPAHSFNGGTGGNGPVSGAGGGGGGATVILVDNELTVVAGGGGGGGGAGSQTKPIDGKSASLSAQSVDPGWRAGGGPRNQFGTAEYCVLPPANIKVNQDTFTFYLYFDKVGTYKFSGSADNQAKFYIDDVLAFQALDWGTIATGTYTITQAGYHKVGIYYYSDGKGGSGFGIQVDYPDNTHFWQTSKSGVSKNGSQTKVYILPSNSSDYRGQDGQTRTDDGGTGGGGGGGYPGGLGGKSNSGDSGAEAGQAGGNFPAYEATRGQDSPYYDNSRGLGGSASGPGYSGYAVLEIVPTVQYVAASAVKVGSEWKQVSKGYVKVFGTWQQITATYVKKNGTWRRLVSGGDQGTLDETQSSDNYGQVQRLYS
jgi:hypothetical protein